MKTTKIQRIVSLCTKPFICFNKDVKKASCATLLHIARNNYKLLEKRVEYIKGKRCIVTVYFASWKIVYDFLAVHEKNDGYIIIPLTIKNVFGTTIAASEIEWMPEKDDSGLLMGFDDCFFEKWARIIDELFPKYRARATFFVNGTEPAEFCYYARSRGQEIASHTANHKILTKTNSREFKNEITDAIDPFVKAGFSFSSFAYPGGYWLNGMTRKVLRYYTVARGFGSDLYIYPKTLLKSGQYIVSKSIDNIKYQSDADYEYDIKRILLMTKFCGSGSLCPLTTHDIDDNADWGITVERLEYLLQQANSLKLNFYLYRDIFQNRQLDEKKNNSPYPMSMVLPGIYSIKQALTRKIKNRHVHLFHI